MRLWPDKMLPFLSDQHILGQHRECCALRGGGWGKKHSTVDYVFTHPPYILEAYHFKVMTEMAMRGFKITPDWKQKGYRGKTERPWNHEDLYGEDCIYKDDIPYPRANFYEEHNEAYWQLCLTNLSDKGFKIKKFPSRQPKKRAIPKKNRSGSHLCACTSCGFSLIGDEDDCCPRCEAAIDLQAQPEAVLVAPGGEPLERQMMSHDKLRLSNMRLKGNMFRWRYISFGDRMRYRRWLGRRLKREDALRGPLAAEIIGIMRSTSNPARAAAYIPANMKSAERKKVWVLWKESQEESSPHRVKGKVI